YLSFTRISVVCHAHGFVRFSAAEDCRILVGNSPRLDQQVPTQLSTVSRWVSCARSGALGESGRSRARSDRYPKGGRIGISSHPSDHTRNATTPHHGNARWPSALGRVL